MKENKITSIIWLKGKYPPSKVIIGKGTLTVRLPPDIHTCAHNEMLTSCVHERASSATPQSMC